MCLVPQGLWKLENIDVAGICPKYWYGKLCKKIVNLSNIGVVAAIPGIADSVRQQQIYKILVWQLPYPPARFQRPCTRRPDITVSNSAVPDTERLIKRTKLSRCSAYFSQRLQLISSNQSKYANFSNTLKYLINKQT